MSMPYDYDQTNIDHLRAVVAEQEATIEYLHERCKAEEVENARLRDIMYDRVHDHGIQHMTEDELRITAANALAENEQLRELLQRALTSHDKMCTQRGNCFRCRFFDAKPFAPACPFVSVIRDARELGVEVN